MEYPIRINKYLAQKKICSRREADDLILQKKIKINGKVAVLGDKVLESDKVVVAKFDKNFIYLALNKPRDIITHSPQMGEKEIKDILNIKEKVFPIGRLDKSSSGLIILTNDGRLTDRLLNPEYDHEKEYIVKTKEPIDNLFVKKMSQGIELDDGYVTKKCKVFKIDNNKFSIILTEGKKHQIRRMCAQLGKVVSDLKRVRIVNIKINSLRPGQFREIKGKELQEFFEKINL
jgi:23S rRNA pseudouridine2604 synthase